MRYIRTYENNSRYKYIRYKIINNSINAIIKYDTITYDYKKFEIDTNIFSEGNYPNLITDFNGTDIMKEPGNFWRDATKEEIEQFEIANSINKYNI